jgi:hypothetical protein
MYSNSVQIGGQGAIFFPNIRTVVEDTGEGHVSIVAANEPLIPLSRRRASCLNPIIHPSRERPRNSPTLATKQPLTVHLPLGLLEPKQHENRALRRWKGHLFPECARDFLGISTSCSTSSPPTCHTDSRNIRVGIRSIGYVDRLGAYYVSALVDAMTTVMLAPLLRWLSIILLCLTVLGDADFESVRTKMRKDRSGKGGDPKDKYFRMSPPVPYQDAVIMGRV